MCIRLILATKNVLREKAAISCGLVEAWMQFPDRATNLSVRCNVQSGSEFCQLAVQWVQGPFSRVKAVGA
jgi:hypothetical protein